jgi:flotillin
MYGDGNSTKVVRDVMNSANQIMEGVKESTGIDISSLIAGFAGGKAALGAVATEEEAKPETEA